MVRLRSPAPYYMGEFPSGQRGQTVNLLSLTSLVRIQLPPPIKKHRPCVGVFLLASGSLAIRNRHLPCKCAGSHLSESRRKLVFVRLSEKSLPLANTMLHRLFIIFIPLHRTFKLPIKLRTRFPAEFFYFLGAYRILPVVAFSVFNKFQFSVRITEQGHYFLH